MEQEQHEKALNLDIGQQQIFVRFYNSLPEKSASTIRFFNRTDYYTIHGDDTAVAVDYFCSLIKYMGNEPKLSYVCLNKAQFESILRELLLVRQYRVEVYVKTSSKGNDWNVEYKGSPGNLTQFEDLLFESDNINFTNCVMAVKIVENKLLAIGCINITEAKFEVCEINDNDSFSELEGLVAQIGPKECIVPSGDSVDLVALKSLLERNGILLAKVKGSDFTENGIEQDLNRLLYFPEEHQRNSAAFKELNLNNAMGCLQALIKFLNLTGDEKNFNQFKLSTIDSHRFVRLDNAALYSLNVLPKATSRTTNIANQQSSKNLSLKGILDNCVTAQGSRLLDQWIKQPLKDYNSINERLDIVEAILQDPEIRTQLAKDWLPRVIDLIPLAKKMSCKRANLQDCYKVYQAVTSVPNIVASLRNLNNKFVNAALIEPLGEVVSELENYQSMIEQTLDFDLVDRGEYFVKGSFDEGLNELQRKKEKIEEKMQKALEKVARDLDFEKGKRVKLDCNDQLGYFFRVTLNDEPILRKRKEYKILDAINKGVRFVTNSLEELKEQYQCTNDEYSERQKAVLDEVFEVAAGYAESLRNLNMLIATVDVLTSFAVAAISARVPYVKPKLHKEGSGILKLKQIRHPCLEAQDNISFIPNDVTFNKDEKLLYVITGPNMCGKSTYIRSVGTCVLMAHIGSLVPCTEAEISVIDGILVRVGAEDCQLKGLSTFMLEMIETSTIIKSATANSLVIIDELGRGTSTYDGCGIAWAIAEHLVKEIKCFSLFATHYHEINELAQMYSTVANLHVSAIVSDNSITPLYQIREGECDNSYGIHCARMAGFTDDVIQDAIEHQKKLEHQNGMKFLTNYDQPTKKRITAEGDIIVENAIKKLKSLDLDKMSDEDLLNKLTEMKNELSLEDNLFVKGLLSV